MFGNGIYFNKLGL